MLRWYLFWQIAGPVYESENSLVRNIRPEADSDYLGDAASIAEAVQYWRLVIRPAICESPSTAKDLMSADRTKGQRVESRYLLSRAPH